MGRPPLYFSSSGQIAARGNITGPYVNHDTRSHRHVGPVRQEPAVVGGSGDEDLLTVPVEVFAGGGLGAFWQEQHLA